MAALTKIVQRAVNFSPDRGDQVDVVNIPFEKGAPVGAPAAAGWQKAVDAGKPFIPAFLILLFLIFVARPLVRWMTKTPALDGRFRKELPMTVGEMEKAFQEPRQIPVSEELTRAVTNNKDQAVHFIREWMKEQK